MSHDLIKIFAALSLMTTATYASCSKTYYDEMTRRYEELKSRVDEAFKDQTMTRINFQYFYGTLGILKDYLDNYWDVVVSPVTLESPDKDQCYSMEMQINDVVDGLTNVLDVEIPQQQVPHPPLAIRPEARGPSPQQSTPGNVLSPQSQPYVQTPETSLGKNVEPEAPMPIQREPQHAE
jgi:hypothetical protein